MNKEKIYKCQENIQSMKEGVFVFLFLAISLIGIMSFVFSLSLPQEFCGVSTGTACSSNSDCKIGGCSGQICGDTGGLATICDYKECYNAKSYGKECTCSQNKCGWTIASTINCAKEGSYIYKDSSLGPTVCCPGLVNSGWITGDNFQTNETVTKGKCVKECASESGVCGGIAGIQCCSGLTCDVNGNYPDNSGICIKKCAKEGEKFSLVYTNEYPSQCCAGLTEWNSGMDTRKVVDNICIETGLVSGLPVGTCINCGDGICKSPENICNCPKDCSVTKKVCTAEDRGKACTEQYNPVCGWFNSNIKCIMFPCAQTFGNSCSACSNKDVEYYTEGSCPALPPECSSDKDCKESVCLNGGFVHEQCVEGKCKLMSTCREEEVKEKVECIFSGSTQLQKCYTAEQNSRAYCSGKESCATDILGYKGERIIWKSTCGGYAYTTIDGTTKSVKFDCGVVGICQPSQCDDGILTECKIDNGQCICSTCPPIVIKPVCGNGICESGEGEICSTTQIMCELGKECKVPPSNCFVVCSQDCKITEPISSNLNEKFKLQMYQTAKIKENGIDVMKINFKDLILSKCGKFQVSGEASSTIETKSAIATGRGIALTEATTTTTDILKCEDSVPSTLLRIDFYASSQTDGTVLSLNLGEKKKIGDFTILFVNYDYASRTGVFLVSKETFLCPQNCKCDENGKTIVCSGECKKGETLCPNGECKKQCEIISEDCKFGCIYDGKCFPIGIRSNGTYCGSELFMSSQKASDEECENNFECSSNVCVSGTCINEGLIRKILSWFKSLFG
ncbi:MAG: hypothetical protein ABIH28_02365 [archaeon]